MPAKINLKRTLMKYLPMRILFIFSLIFQVVLPAQSNEFSLLTWNILGPLAPDVADFFPAENSDRTEILNLFTILKNPLFKNFNKTQAQKFDLFITNFQHRADKIIQNILAFDPDIICLQEVKKDIFDKFFEKDLSKNYQAAFSVAMAQEKSKTSGNVILYKGSKFKSISSYGDQLPSETGTGACACALLQSKQNPADTVWICSVHISREPVITLDYASAQDTKSGDNQLQLMINSLALRQIETTLSQSATAAPTTLSDLSAQLSPIIIAGDFNTLYKEVLEHTSHLLKMNMFQHSSFTENHKKGNFHTYHRDEDFGSIDHILFDRITIIPNRSKVGLHNEYFNHQVPKLSKYVLGSELTPPQRYLAIHDHYLSDHLPVFATFSFTPSGSSATTQPNIPPLSAPTSGPSQTPTQQAPGLFQNIFSHLPSWLGGQQQPVHQPQTQPVPAQGPIPAQTISKLIDILDIIDQSQFRQRVKTFHAQTAEKPITITIPNSQTQLIITIDNMMTMPVDAIVNAANKNIQGGGGIDGVITGNKDHHTGNQINPAQGDTSGQILNQLKILKTAKIAPIQSDGTLPEGKAVITESGSIKGQGAKTIRYVIATVGPKGSADATKQHQLSSCYYESLSLAANINNSATQMLNQLVSGMKKGIQPNIKTIAFPSISTGIFGYPADHAAHASIKACLEFIKNNPTDFDKIYLVFLPAHIDPQSHNAYQAAKTFVTQHLRKFYPNVQIS